MLHFLLIFISGWLPVEQFPPVAWNLSSFDTVWNAEAIPNSKCPDARPQISQCNACSTVAARRSLQVYDHPLIGSLCNAFRCFSFLVNVVPPISCALEHENQSMFHLYIYIYIIYIILSISFHIFPYLSMFCVKQQAWGCRVLYLSMAFRVDGPERPEQMSSPEMTLDIAWYHSVTMVGSVWARSWT